MKALLSIFAAVISIPSWGAPAGVAWRPTAAQLSFTFTDQEGAVNMSCTHKLQPNTLDWEITCGDGFRQEIHRFVAHLVLKAYQRQTAPKRAYEILYWVTNLQADPGQPGRSVGSTIWVNLNEPSDLSSLDLGQDVEENYVLRANIRII